MPLHGPQVSVWHYGATMINLLPWRKQQKYRKLQLFLLAVLITILLSLVLLWQIAAVLKIKITQTAHTNKNLQQHMYQLEQNNNHLMQAQTQQKVQAQASQQITDVQQQQQTIHQFLAVLMHIIPRQIYLVQIKYNDWVFLLTGQAASNAALAEFMGNIERLHWIKDCRLIVSNQIAETQEIQFKLSVSL